MIIADSFERLRDLVIHWRNAMDDRIGSRAEAAQTDVERDEYLAIITELETLWKHQALIRSLGDPKVWRPLPPEVKRRWWSETNYGRTEPTPELIEAMAKAVGTT